VPPVRLVHLGMGNFFRAHQAWYTDHAPDADEWGIAAFSGRSGGLADLLTAQQGLYTLVTRAPDGDRFETIASLSAAHAAADHAAWLTYLARPAVQAITMTITEAGYFQGAGGGLDRHHPEVRADVEALRRDLTMPVGTAPGRLVAGLAARRSADAGPLTLVSCDNLPGNGSVVGRVVADLAEMVGSGLGAWVGDFVSTVTTMVDRVTPKTQGEDVRLVARATGLDDRAPVVTEPFAEWVLCGAFCGDRPRWENAGATITADIVPFEERKLWLLNGAHSLLAYLGSTAGHSTVAEAFVDDIYREWLEQWWNEASAHLTLPPDESEHYRAALATRFSNPRIRHRLEQIATDGSQKLPARILPVLRLERAAGRLPPAAIAVLAGWVCHLRGLGVAVHDVHATTLLPLAKGPLADAVPRIINALDPALAADHDLVSAIVAQAQGLEFGEGR
jgi:fructuronate reductase